jgi:hypothetical protein
MNHIQKLLEIDIGVAKSTLQRVAIDLVMKRKDYDASIGMLHLHMTAFPMHLNEA